jgi:hypothetical protein
MDAPRPIEERRRRIRVWLRFRELDHVIRRVDGDGTECGICGRGLDPGELAFVVTFTSTMTLHLDRMCMDLWCSEVAALPSAS